MGLRKLIQFGDSFDNEIFPFTPYEEEEEMPSELQLQTTQLQFADGDFRNNGFDQSREPSRTLTKRFVLYDKTISDLVRSNDRSIIGRPLCTNSREAFLSDFTDYMYRALRGGVKRLYMITEDGSVRWCLAECVSIPYAKTFSEGKIWTAFVLSFYMHDPTWYEVGDGVTFYYTKQTVPFEYLVNPLITPSGDYDYRIEKLTRLCPSCYYDGVIVRDESLQGYVGAGGECGTAECSQDPCTLPYGEFYSVSGDTQITVDVTGSKGATKPTISFYSTFSNPKIINTRNNDYVLYNGDIGNDEYLRIYLNSSDLADPTEMTIETNITGFDANDVEINSDDGTNFELEVGRNILIVESGDGNAKIFINYFNKYAN